MRISDWSSDVCSSDLSGGPRPGSHSRAGRASIGPVTTRAYTDGACSGNPGPGGWAWAVPDGPYASGAAAQTTNQRMEITAAYEAVRAIDGRLEIVSDSTYVVRSEEHTSELQSLMRISYAVFCLKKKKH